MIFVYRPNAVDNLIAFPGYGFDVLGNLPERLNGTFWKAKHHGGSDHFEFDVNAERISENRRGDGWLGLNRSNKENGQLVFDLCPKG